MLNTSHKLELLTADRDIQASFRFPPTPQHAKLPVTPVAGEACRHWGPHHRGHGAPATLQGKRWPPVLIYLSGPGSIYPPTELMGVLTCILNVNRNMYTCISPPAWTFYTCIRRGWCAELVDSWDHWGGSSMFLPSSAFSYPEAISSLEEYQCHAWSCSENQSPHYVDLASIYGRPVPLKCPGLPLVYLTYFSSTICSWMGRGAQLCIR